MPVYKLTVRSFSGRFVSIETQLRIDGHREIEEYENPFLHTREGRQMTPLPAAFPDDRQRQALKRLQQAFCRGVRGRPLRVADIQPLQRCLGPGQALAHLKLEQGQDPQPNGQQADQAGGVVIAFQIHRRQRQGPTFQTAHRPLDQILVAVRQDGLLQGELRTGLGGHIDPPAQVAYRRGHGFLVEADGHLALPLQANCGDLAAMAPPGAFRVAVRIPDMQQALDPIARQNGVYRLSQRPRVGPSSPAPTVGIQRRDRCLRLSQPAVQSPLPRLGQLDRADHQAAFLPVIPVAREFGGHRFHPLKPFRDQLGGAIRRGAVEQAQRLLPRPHWRQVVRQGRRGQLAFRQRAQVVVASVLDEGPRLEAAILQSPTYSSPERLRPSRTRVMAGMYSGSSARWPATTSVATGMPSGSKAETMIFTWGKSGRWSLLWPNWNSPSSVTRQ